MASSVASAACKSSLQVSCTCYSSNAAGESKVLPRPGLSLASAKVSSPLKLVSNGSKVNMMREGEKKGIDHAGGATALALLAAAIIPEVAEAAQPGISPSLKNLLLSVVAGGIVLVVIGGAVAAVSTFDPVKRK